MSESSEPVPMAVRDLAVGKGLRLPYVARGQETANPVVLVHGFAGSHREFGPLLPHLPRAMRIVAPTLRGHGDAGKPDGEYTLRVLAADLSGLLDGLDIRAAVVVGHSMGAAVAQRLAIDHPDRTRALVLVGACPIDREAPSQARDFYESTVRDLRDPIDPALLEEFLRTTVAAPLPDPVAAALARDARKVPARVWRALWRDRLEGTSRVDLGRIAAPTLLLWGDRDVRCPRREQDALLHALPDARLVTYEGVGHSPHLEAPGRVAADLVAFVRALDL